MSLFFVTTNHDKFLEVSSFLENLNIEQANIEVPEIQSEDHFEVIWEKALAARKHIKEDFIIEDMAFYIDALKGRPGTLVKFFVGPLGGGDQVYDLVHSYNPKNKGAFESTALAYFEKDKKDPIIFINTIRGKLVKPAGTRAFGFDRIFMAEGQSKTYAEMPIEEKNKVSSRGRCLRDLENLLTNQELGKTVAGTC